MLLSMFVFLFIFVIDRYNKFGTYVDCLLVLYAENVKQKNIVHIRIMSVCWCLVMARIMVITTLTHIDKYGEHCQVPHETSIS